MSQFDYSPQYRNPSGTVPGPRPYDVPRTLWTQTQDLDWGTGSAPGGHGPPGHQWTAVWNSPTFDLRPDLRSAQGAVKAGEPVWSRSARLFFQLATSPTNIPFPTAGPAPTSGLSVIATDYTSVVRAESIPRVAEGGLTPGPALSNVRSVDVSSMFAPSLSAPGLGASQAAQVGFAPPGSNLGFGEGYPIRYWRLRLTIVFTNETGVPVPPVPDVGAAGAPPFMRLQAGMY